jgi:antitoxin component of RelBE/YafQ-DinJ toxin-antitoxin module
MILDLKKKRSLNHLTFRCNDDLKTQIEQFAKDEDATISEVVRFALHSLISKK